jgi:hypothetical protein
MSVTLMGRTNQYWYAVARDGSDGGLSSRQVAFGM